MVDIRETDPRDWVYISEGRATIVFSYRGPEHPDFSNTVLRLRKSGLHIPQSTQGNSDGGNTDQDDPIINYQTRCMQKLIPHEYLPMLRTVYLEKSWLKELVDLREPDRPMQRKETGRIDLTRTKGVLATDLVSGEYLAVEIKPKWAFLPSPVHLSEKTRPIKTRTCRFCMHSHLKAQKGQEVATNYCPLDLFSGDKVRVTKAVSSLWDAWLVSNGAINNLKIFARGKVVMPSETWRLLKKGSPYDIDIQSTGYAFVMSLVAALLTTPVLSILSRLQRDLDSLDIEGLSKLWQVAASSPLRRHKFASSPEHGVQAPFSESSGTTDTGPLDVEEPEIAKWTEFLDMYMSPDKSELDNANPSPECLDYYIMSYLLSATFKDCSIIVRLDLLDISRPGEIGGSGGVTVIDLEPKSVKKFKTWEALDKEIVHNYAQAAHSKVCIDAGRQAFIK